MQKTNVIKLHPIHGVVALLLAVLFALSFGLFSSQALAEDLDDQEALYEPEVVTLETATVDTPTYVTYEKTSGNYQVILCGVTDANKDALADAALANAQKETPVKFVNQNFVDAEKYSVTCEEFDKYHCWLGSTSNILTMTGWAQHYTNPITGTTFANEDDVLSFLSSSFQDSSGLPNLAYSYFFDGLYGGTAHCYNRTSESTAIKPFAGVSHAGFDTQVCSEGLVKRLKCGSALFALEALEKLQDYALEMSIEGGTSHSVAVTGVVIDQSKQGSDRYVAILIADTDNEESTSNNPPTSFTEANTAKSQKTNSYTMYHLGTAVNDGQTVMQIQHYMKHDDMTYIGSFTRVNYYSEDVRSAALETASNATKNAKTTGDVALYDLSTFDSTYTTKDTYQLTDQITLQAVIIGMNTDVAFDTKTTGYDAMENRVEVYRDGQKVGTITSAAALTLANGVDLRVGERVNINLSAYDFMKTPGNYTLTFYLNTNNVPEAYVMNDASPQSVSFTIAQNKDEGEQNAETPDDSSESTTSNESASPAGIMAATGDVSGAVAAIACFMMLLSAALLCFARRHS